MKKIDPVAVEAVWRMVPSSIDDEDAPCRATVKEILIIYHEYLAANGMQIRPIAPTEDMFVAACEKADDCNVFGLDDEIIAEMYKAMNAAWETEDG